jgi:ectoine hydroxylase-related dioxygenase (phytanoyl-CoA dioxygenase family)
VSVDAAVKRHPWNTEFAWQDHAPPYRRIAPDQARQFDEQGFFVMNDVFDPAVVADVRGEIDGHEAKLEEVLRRQDNDRILIAEAGAITFTTHLVTRSPRLRAFAADDVFADLCIDLVGPDANLYWDQAVYKKPEKPRRFPWHQDNGYTFVEPQQYLTCWVALTDATVENGCPQVVPGLHRLGTLAHRYVDPLGFECFADPDRVVAAPVRAGGIVVFSSLTPHLTGPNTTGHVRKAYILQYAPSGARIQEGDAHAGPPTGEAAADDPGRQFSVARAGRPIAAP